MKLSLRNFAGEDHDGLLEEKAAIILATVSESLPSGVVYLEKVKRDSGRKPDFHCRLMICLKGQYMEWCRSTHSNASLAVETVFLRLRRQIIRQNIPGRRHMLRTGWVN